MVEKLREYEGFLGLWHRVRESTNEKWNEFRENHRVKDIFKQPEPADLMPNGGQELSEFSHIYRRKTRLELVRLSAAVMGIEVSYSAETAFVSPIFLKIGVKHKHMTMIWGLSPLVGFFLTPVLGSLSDKCTLQMGRRRPFILLMSLGILIGLLLIPNGESLGYYFGDGQTSISDTSNGTSVNASATEKTPVSNSHPWGVFFTIIGTVLLDFDADACQSPSRSYLLDVSLPEEHARGLSTFTIMAGLGGFFGYSLGAIDWDVTALGVLFGGHVRAVFSIITVMFVICVLYTVTCFREIPLSVLERFEHIQMTSNISSSPNNTDDIKGEGPRNGETKSFAQDADKAYGATDDNVLSRNPFHTTGKEKTDVDNSGYVNYGYEGSIQERPSISPAPPVSLKHYLKSIVFMPASIRIVCLTNLFCWMSHVCYSLYFTDFVGEAVFLGNPTAADGSPEFKLYEEGVRFGCWGMATYSLSCSCYSLIIERLIKKFRARNVYVIGLLTETISMTCMATLRNRVAVIVFSCSAGVLYCSLFTLPYLLIANYHAKSTFELNENGEPKVGNHVRGLGTDVAIVSSTVFLAQFILSMCMGTIVSWANTTTAVVAMSAILSFCAAICATRIMYLDL